MTKTTEPKSERRPLDDAEGQAQAMMLSRREFRHQQDAEKYPMTSKSVIPAVAKRRAGIHNRLM
jgi:hypothetical protein